MKWRNYRIFFPRFISDFTSQTAITHCQSKHSLSRFIAICTSKHEARWKLPTQPDNTGKSITIQNRVY